MDCGCVYGISIPSVFGYSVGFHLWKFFLMPVGSPRERKNLSQAKVLAQLGTTSYRLACLRTTRALAALAISYSQVVNTVCLNRRFIDVVCYKSPNTTLEASATWP